MPPTLAGGQQIDRPVFTDLTQPDRDRSTTPESDIQEFLQRNNMFRCEAFACLMRPEQCVVNRVNNNYLCGKCQQDYPGRTSSFSPSIEAPKKFEKRHKGDNPESPWRYHNAVAAKSSSGKKKGFCPHCERPDQILFGDKCGRCMKRISMGIDVKAADRRGRGRQ